MYFPKGLLSALLLQLLLLQISTSSDTISFDHSIKDGEFLVSKNETFVLGFFSPGTSSNRYVGIWYKFSAELVLWVANRDNPVNDTTGILTVGSDGNLVLVRNNSLSMPMWSTNLSASSSSNNTITAQLLDSGNYFFLS